MGLLVMFLILFCSLSFAEIPAVKNEKSRLGTILQVDRRHENAEDDLVTGSSRRDIGDDDVISQYESLPYRGQQTRRVDVGDRDSSVGLPTDDVVCTYARRSRLCALDTVKETGSCRREFYQCIPPGKFIQRKCGKSYRFDISVKRCRQLTQLPNCQPGGNVLRDVKNNNRGGASTVFASESSYLPAYSVVHPEMNYLEGQYPYYWQGQYPYYWQDQYPYYWENQYPYYPYYPYNPVRNNYFNSAFDAFSLQPYPIPDIPFTSDAYQAPSFSDTPAAPYSHSFSSDVPDLELSGYANAEVPFEYSTLNMPHSQESVPPEHSIPNLQENQQIPYDSPLYGSWPPTPSTFNFPADSISSVNSEPRFPDMVENFSPDGRMQQYAGPYTADAQLAQQDDGAVGTQEKLRTNHLFESYGYGQQPSYGVSDVFSRPAYSMPDVPFASDSYPTSGFSSTPTAPSSNLLSNVVSAPALPSYANAEVPFEHPAVNMPHSQESVPPVHSIPNLQENQVISHDSSLYGSRPLTPNTNFQAESVTPVNSEPRFPDAVENFSPDGRMQQYAGANNADAQLVQQNDGAVDAQEKLRTDHQFANDGYGQQPSDETGDNFSMNGNENVGKLDTFQQKEQDLEDAGSGVEDSAADDLGVEDLDKEAKQKEDSSKEGSNKETKHEENSGNEAARSVDIVMEKLNKDLKTPDWVANGTSPRPS